MAALSVAVGLCALAPRSQVGFGVWGFGYKKGEDRALGVSSSGGLHGAGSLEAAWTAFADLQKAGRAEAKASQNPKP